MAYVVRIRVCRGKGQEDDISPRHKRVGQFSFLGLVSDAHVPGERVVAKLRKGVYPQPDQGYACHAGNGARARGFARMPLSIREGDRDNRVLAEFPDGPIEAGG
ncbi:MAG: hypothetical protein A2268_14215 [Candidatus Raymondbacteria bacterium RifOxyA12_full_50_37]|uniref:Uncharacterized protein n=1 Tax=Candidatus Raymondbacteria bacterium RIFOXYD12_FULL_49_13 TaxID=1817890 RepID=A0A1F7FKN9_UNCRA|nr:MAG: hypothetical protein A2268_14215 [Candidatus Raymondbacteria bacterium RifOxyA12_full_50_37]OGJ86914.1 MAG: hypothetical protein A2350_02125 [Candidatus Raymondbacteria bacterium RifOxyB12_full_50_8]OGJ88234.1 MAG: hypothetical protein A2248_19555 [Candidatus Raymondbacteria bacterium RIFOXYA2_FULL_49_16]OGJ97101.1 MAG: hypothetical protein A2487_05865 [Candidatus Raymondbacteria bacterium RifOxyC12_full_50_8]OGK07279.1 MAG: hypothetical protein A2519_14225 [Candidatus Raymondbacteria b